MLIILSEKNTFALKKQNRFGNQSLERDKMVDLQKHPNLVCHLNYFYWLYDSAFLLAGLCAPPDRFSQNQLQVR